MQAFLTRVANNSVGARELTSINALNYLSQCQFIDLRPSHHDSGSLLNQEQSFIPSVSERYKQMLFPLMKFLLALLTCPGSHHKDLTTQVTSLIGEHSDVFAAILKEQHPVVTMATLQELALVTAVIGHSGVGQYKHLMCSYKHMCNKLLQVMIGHHNPPLPLGLG